VIAATNKNLKEEITKGNFREDLFHRLAVILIKVPSLNSRAEDIPLLVDYFSDKISKSQGITNKAFTKDAISLLKSYDWSGNIRGLRNVVERLIILGDEREITENNIKEYSNK
jgi:DNA-binding NtrC family response regulator